MATQIFRGDAPKVAQVQDYLFDGTWESTDVITVTCNGKPGVSMAAGSTAITTIIDSLVTAINAVDTDNYPEFADFTASRSGNYLRLTADEEGVPFTVTVATTETGGGAADAQTIDGTTSSTGTATTASSGPNALIAANMSGAALPGNGDTLIFENSDVDLLYGLEALVAVTTLTVIIRGSYTGKIGLPKHNGRYAEYRQAYLQTSGGTFYIGQGPGQGSQRIKIDSGSAATTLHLHGAAASAEDGLEAVLWKGTHASNIVNVTRGSLGVAVLGGETATIATLRVGYQTSPESDSDVRCGTGVTLTTIDKSGGRLAIASNAVTVDQTVGELTIDGSATVTTLSLFGGACFYKSTGTATTVNVYANAVIDLRQDMQARTFTTTNLYGVPAGQKAFIDPERTVTLSNWNTYGCGADAFDRGLKLASAL